MDFWVLRIADDDMCTMKVDSVELGSVVRETGRIKIALCGCQFESVRQAERFGVL